MSNKLAKLSEEEKQKQIDESFLKGRPNRLEVMNYVNSIIEEKYLPEVYAKMQLSIMTLQAILINKGIVTGEEIEKITQEFLERSKEEQQKPEKES